MTCTLFLAKTATQGWSKINFQGPELELPLLCGAAGNPASTQGKNTTDPENSKGQNCRTENL